MKFENYLKENKKNLEFDQDLDSAWNQIETALAPKTNELWKVISIGILVLMILVLGLVTVLNKNHETIKSDNSKSVLFANLKAKESSNRILALNNIALSKDQEVIYALINTLENDESVNVKLAAARALEKFINHEEVRIALIDQLVKVDHAYLKVTIINLLGRKKVKSSVHAMNQILEDESAPNLIRQAIEQNKKDILKI